MPRTDAEPIYHRLVIEATEPETEIWLAGDEGFLVQKEIGTLDSHLLPGTYTVEFGLGAPPYEIRLAGGARLTEKELTAGPTCPRRVPELPDGAAE